MTKQMNFNCPVAPGGTPYNSLYGEALPERGTFQVYERVGISKTEVFKRVGKSVI